MNLLSRCKPAVSFTDLTKRVQCYVSVTDSFPRSSVPFLHFRRTVIFLISFILLSLVFLAEPSVCKVRTTRKGTRAFWFIWHNNHPFAQKKPLQVYSYKGFVLFLITFSLCGISFFYISPKDFLFSFKATKSISPSSSTLSTVHTGSRSSSVISIQIQPGILSQCAPPITV